jgi:hypothetical protein
MKDRNVSGALKGSIEPKFHVLSAICFYCGRHFHHRTLKFGEMGVGALNNALNLFQNFRPIG